MFDMFGPLHLLILIVAVPTAAILACYAAKKYGGLRKDYSFIIMCGWLVMICDELFGWFVVWGIPDINTIVAHLPFFPCSTPLWLLPLLLFLPERFEKTKRTIEAYIPSFVLCWVVVFFVSDEGIEPTLYMVQSNVYHLVLMFIALFIAFSNDNRTQTRDYVRAIGLYLALCAAALVINYASYYLSNGVVKLELMYVHVHEYALPAFADIDRSVGHIAAIAAMIALSIVGSFIFRVGMNTIKRLSLPRLNK